MAKNPAFPFYAQDFLVDTMRWDRAMKGLHVDLLCESWINGGLKNIKGFPAGIDGEDKLLWKKIKSKWTLTDGVWINSKLEEVRAARQKFIEKQSEKGKKSAAKRTILVEPEPSSGSTVVEPYEIEKEIEKEKDLDLKEGVQGKPLDLEFILNNALDEGYLDQEQMKWPHLDFWFEVETFKNKVRGSPDEYEDRDKGGIRNAFQYQLRNSKGKPKNGTSTNKSTDHLSSLMEGYQRRHGGAASK
jgi:hypothetical protein